MVVSHTGNYPIDVGGPQAVAHYVCLGLAKEGFKVTLYQRFTSHDARKTWQATPEARHLRDAGVDTPYLVADYSLRNLPRYPWFILGSNRLMGDGQYDVVHYNSPPVDANMMLPSRFASKGCAQTVAIHGGLFYESRNTLGRLVFRRSVKHYVAAVAFNSFSRKIALNQGLPERRVHVVPNGVDTDRIGRTPQRLLEGEPSVFYAGRLEAIKGVHTLIEATRMLAPRLPRIKVYFAGNGSLAQTVRGFAIRSPEHAVYLGRLPSVWDVVSYMKGANLVVIPSLKENLSITLLEAMASGTPLVVSDAEGNMDVVDQESAWVFRAGSAEHLAQKIQDAYTDTDASKTRAARALAKAKDTYSWRTVTKKYLELFSDLANGGGQQS